MTSVKNPSGVPSFLLVDVNGNLLTKSHSAGAGEVSTVMQIVNNSSTVTTALTPASGKKVRILSVNVMGSSNTLMIGEVYFGTGANLDADETKAIALCLINDVLPSFFASWPDGGGPVGQADEVLSVRTTAAVATNTRFLIVYREE